MVRLQDGRDQAAPQQAERNPISRSEAARWLHVGNAIGTAFFRLTYTLRASLGGFNRRREAGTGGAADPLDGETNQR